jgi:ABC-type phosphate transport system substrate-binding protein
MLRNRLSVAILALAVGHSAGAEETYRIVVHPKNPVVAVDRATLARVFLKKIATWDDGTPVTAIDQERTAAVRGSFSRDVHKKDADAIAAYWATLVYSGRDTPPAVKRSDDEVIEFVRRNPGAVGYVSSTATPDGVKVIGVR